MKSGLHLPRGHFRLDVFDHDAGRVVEVVDEPNTIVRGARTAHARLLGGDTAGRTVTKIGFGQGGLATNTAMTSLTSAYIKALSVAGYGTYSVQFAFSLATNEFNGGVIREFGLIMGNGLLYARKSRGDDGLIKTSNMSLNGSWTIEFPDGF
jgi:hypothetical protein